MLEHRSRRASALSLAWSLASLGDRWSSGAPAGAAFYDPDLSTVTTFIGLGQCGAPNIKAAGSVAARSQPGPESNLRRTQRKLRGCSERRYVRTPPRDGFDQLHVEEELTDGRQVANHIEILEPSALSLSPEPRMVQSDAVTAPIACAKPRLFMFTLPSASALSSRPLPHLSRAGHTGRYYVLLTAAGVESNQAAGHGRSPHDGSVAVHIQRDAGADLAMPAQLRTDGRP